jgi:hypothetical protein
MNILYVGPYRQNDDHGILSKLYLQNLIEANHKVTCRPLYFSTKYIEPYSQNTLKYENAIYDSYDCLIQHCPIDMMQKHGGFLKNVAIPIFGNSKNMKPHQINNLRLFDKIIVDNDTDETTLVRSGVDQNISRITCPIIEDLAVKLKDKKLNLGLHNSATKFYLFGNLVDHANIIQKILVSFYISFRCEYGKSLVLLLEEADKKEQLNFLNMIKDLKTKLKILSSDRSISEFVIFKNFSLEEKIVAHNTCHVFLNVTQKSTLQEKYAQYFGNTVLSHQNIETIDVPDYASENYSTGDVYESIITESLISQLKESVQLPHKTETSNNNHINLNLSSIL